MNIGGKNWLINKKLMTVFTMIDPAPNTTEHSNNQGLNHAVVNESLQKIGRETGIILIGMIIGMISSFVARIILIRGTSTSEYGIYSLALVIVSVFGLISVLGLRDGTARYIAFFRGKNDQENARNTIRSSVQIVLISGIIFSVILFFSAEFISKNIFHNVNLVVPLQIMTLALPFILLIEIFAAIFRGYGSGAPKVLFQDILTNVFFLILLSLIILLNLSFLSIFYAYSVSTIVVCILFVFFIKRKMHLFNRRKKYEKVSSHVTRNLLVFSVPLLFISVLNNIMHWTDTLMLGYFKTSSVVGIYNGAITLVTLLPTLLTAAAFIFIPITTELYAKNMIWEIGRCYQMLTKWVFLGTIPIFFILVIFPKISLNFLFGPAYGGAAFPLVILSFGSMFSVFLGFNALSLISMGRTKYIMVVSFTGMLSNVVINVLLVPSYGMTGAAIGTFSSYWIVNILNSIKLYRLTKVHPFSLSYKKLLIISVILFIAFYLMTIFIKIKVWMVPVILVIFLVVYVVSLLLTKSFDRTDFEVLLYVEKKTGLKLKRTKKLFRRYT
jgi:O-antigen/teichoic acid export membrane protein